VEELQAFYLERAFSVVPLSFLFSVLHTLLRVLGWQYAFECNEWGKSSTK
jgi:hypothetical protein